MTRDSETDLLISQKIYAKNILIPPHAAERLIVDLPLSAELIRKLNFFKFYKLGDLNLIPYQKILKKFIKVNLASYNLIAELYVFIKSLELLQTSRTEEDPFDSKKKEKNFTTESEKEETEIRNQNKAEELAIKHSSAIQSNNNSIDEFEAFLEETIFIAPALREYSINLLKLSVRLENVLRSLDVENLGDLHEMSVRQIFHAKNCGRKSVFELRDLIEKIQREESAASFQKKEIAEESESEKIHIPPAVRDLPISFLVDSEGTRKNFYSLKVKTLGDLQALPIERIKKNRKIDKQTFSKLLELIENALDGKFDKHLEGEQPQSFINKLVSRLSRKVSVPENLRDVSAGRVHFSSRLAKILRNLNVEDLGDLEKFTFDDLRSATGAGKDSVFELWQFLARMQKEADSGNDLLEKLEAGSQVEIALPELSLNGLLKFVNEFLADLPEREREILLARFGGSENEKVLTLSELGEKFQVTRERVRQVEKDNLGKLKRRIAGVSENALRKIKDETTVAVCPLTPRFLIHLTKNDYQFFEHSPNFYLHLLKKLAPEIYIFPENQTPVQSAKNVSALSRKIKTLLDEQTEFLTLARVFERLSEQNALTDFTMYDFFEAIRNKNFIVENGDAPDVLLIATDKNRLNFIEMARQVLETSASSLKPAEIIERAGEMFGSGVELPSEIRLINLPFYEEDFYLLDRKTIGLRKHFRLPEEKWKQLRDDFYELLKNSKRPVSTTEVLGKKSFDWTNQTTASEATEILRGDERFKDLGRFLFALSEWQMEEREPVKNLAIRVLEETGNPLTASEIGEQIQNFRSVTATSMRTVLLGHDEIREYNFGHFNYYGLKKWDDDFQDFFITKKNLIYHLIKRTATMTFAVLCQEFGIDYESETANKLWRELRALDNLRFNPVYKSPETKITKA